MALGDIHLRFTWQACYLVTSTHTQLVVTQAWQAWHLWHWAGSGGALGFRCGAGTPRLSAWQAWRLETSIFFSRGRRGTWWHRLLLWRGRRGTYGTGLALAARLVFGVAPGRRGCWRGMRGTWRHPSSFHVAGVVLVDIDFYSGVAGVALMALGWPWRRAWFLVWRRDAAAVGVAGMALGDIHLRLPWQAWYLVTSTSTFAWQAWHVWHWAGSGGALGLEWNAGAPRLLAWQAWHLATSTFVLRGRRGTGWHPLSLCVACVALGDIDRHFAWQASHLSHTQLVHTQLVLTQLAHTTCPHTACPHTICPHTTCSHTTCPHTTCPHTTCPHTTCPHTTCPHTTCSHTTCPHTICPHNLSTAQHTTCLFGSKTDMHTHTHLTHNLSPHNFLTQFAHTQIPHNLLTHGFLPSCTRQSFTISFLFPAFPMPCLPFTFLLLLVWRSWHVVLSGPLIPHLPGEGR